MNPNFIYPKTSKYVPPPPPTITSQQIKKANTVAPTQQPMLPPPPPPQPIPTQPIPEQQGFWFKPMVSKEAVAGAPDWLRPAAEFATQLTTPFDVA